MFLFFYIVPFVFIYCIFSISYIFFILSFFIFSFVCCRFKVVSIMTTNIFYHHIIITLFIFCWLIVQWRLNTFVQFWWTVVYRIDRYLQHQKIIWLCRRLKVFRHMFIHNLCEKGCWLFHIQCWTLWKCNKILSSVGERLSNQYLKRFFLLSGFFIILVRVTLEVVNMVDIIIWNLYSSSSTKCWTVGPVSSKSSSSLITTSTTYKKINCNGSKSKASKLMSKCSCHSSQLKLIFVLCH